MIFFTGRYSGFLKEKKIKENEGDKNKKKKKSKRDDVVLTPIVSLTSVIAAVKNLEEKAKVCVCVCVCVDYVCVCVCVCECVREREMVGVGWEINDQFYKN